MFKEKVAAAVAVPALLAGNVYAAVPEGVTTAIETGTTDMKTVAGLMLIALVGLVAFRLIRRAL